MTQGSEPIDTASAIRTRLASLSPEQQKPGTLTQWADTKNNNYWEFVGNGKTTGSELMGTVVDREVEGLKPDTPGASLAPFAHNPEFARYAAEALLAKDNPSYNPDAPLPKGQVEEISVQELVKLATPFLEKYAAAVRAHDGVTPGGTVGDGDHRKLTGQLPSIGLALPIDD